MWTIAAGIILALLILAFLPYIVGGAIGLFAIAIAAAVIFGAGDFLLNNFSDAVFLLALAILAGALRFLYSIYLQSRSPRLFARQLLLLATPAVSQKTSREGTRARAPSERNSRLLRHKKLSHSQRSDLRALGRSSPTLAQAP